MISLIIYLFQIHFNFKNTESKEPAMVPVLLICSSYLKFSGFRHFNSSVTNMPSLRMSLPSK